MASSHHWRNVWRNIARSRPIWAQDFTRTSQKNNRTSQKNNYQHSRNFWNFLFITYHSYWESYNVSTYYTSKQMYNWMKWLRLLGGWLFIVATAIKPPKAACQFAADDILLHEFCYCNPMDLLHHLEKGKEELSPLQYHIKSLQYHIKTLQEESDKKSNIPWIWRIIYGDKLPYMKKTRKKKQVCGAACFMVAEIKFSKDVRLSHLFDNIPLIVSSWNFQELLPLTDMMSLQKVKVKVTEVMTPLSCFRTLTPVWIHIWRWNEGQRLMLLRRGVLLFFKVIHQISRSHG